MPRATWGDVKAFCRQQGYTEHTGDHIRFDMGLPDGSSSGTMVSHSVVDTSPVPATLWTLIWRRQLRLVSEADFWRGLRGETVRYAIPPIPEPPQPLPLYLQRFLREIAHLSEAEIAQTPRDEAQRRYDEYNARQR